VVAAHLAVEGADRYAVQPQQADQEVLHLSSPSPLTALRPNEDPLETTVEVGAEFRVRRLGRRGEGADDHLAAGRKVGESFTAQVAESALHPVPDDRVAHGSADHEPEPGR
jgi:hypothetical protein